MKKFLLALICIPFFGLTQNFNIINEVSFGGNSSDVLEVLPIGDGSGYFYYGTSNSSTASIDHTASNYGNSDFWLIKTDLNNNIVWDKTFGGSGTDSGLSAVRIDSFLYFAGVSDSPISGNKTVNTNGGSDIWVLKLDLDGNIIWQYSYGGTDSESTVEIDSYSGQLLIYSISQSSNSGNVGLTNHGSKDCWILLADTLDGTIHDEAMIGSTSIETFGSLDVIDNRIFIMTNTYGGDGDIPQMATGVSTDIVLFELNSNLDIIQTKGYWGNSTDIGRRLLKKSANEYYLIADSQSPISGTKSSDPFGSSDVWILKLDANLDIVWDTIYGGTNSDVSSHYATIDDNGQLVILCVSSSIAGSGNKTAALYGFDDMWLLVVDPNTADLTIDYSYGGSDTDYATGLMPLGNGQLMITGASNSPISGNRGVPLKGNQDTWIIKIDGSNFLQIPEMDPSNSFQFYPNPFDDHITLSFQSDAHSGSVRFITIDGRELRSEVILQGTTIMDFDFPEYHGVLFYTISQQDVLYTGILLRN